MLDKKQQQELIDSGMELKEETAYIAYKQVPDETENSIVAMKTFGYPEEWNHSIGMSYELRVKRENMISAITSNDICEKGLGMENPLIGHVPSKAEILEELDDLLMSM